MEFIIKDGVLTDYMGEDENVVIPEGVEEIAEGVFKNCTFIKTAIFPEGLKYIKNFAFMGCSSLVEIRLPQNVGIWERTFGGCAALKEVTIPSGTSCHREGQFENCTSLESIMIEPNNGFAGILMFSGCTNLKNLTCMNSRQERAIYPMSPATFKGVKDLLIYAPHIPVSDEWFKNFRSWALNGFLKCYYEGRHFDEDVLAANRKFVNSQRKKLYADADELLIRYMTEEKIIPVADIEMVIEMVEDKKLQAVLEEYKNVNFTAKQTEKVKAKKQKDAEKPVNPLSPAELKKEWIFNNLADGTIEVTGYKGLATEVVVPAMVGKKRVSRIGWNAFNPYALRITNSTVRKSITSVVIPEGVTAIGESAFEGCESLENITIPESVKWVECYAFNRTKWFENLYNNTKGDFVTFNNILLLYKGEKADVEVPEGITAIGGLAFSFNKKQPLKLPVDRFKFDRFRKAKKEPTEAPPFNVYEYKTLLKSVKLSQSLKILCPHAFCNCTALTEIEIPKSVVRIGDGAFRNCHALTEVTIPDGVAIIDNNTFEYCDNLETVHIPDSVKYIRDSAFYNCISLTDVKLPKNVEWIGNSAFTDCKSLRQFEIPRGVDVINQSVFHGCANLKDVTIPEGVKAIKQCAFSGCLSLTDIELPEGVTELEYLSFSHGPYYRTMSIPASVTNIDKGAFSNENPDYEFDGYYSGFTIVAPKDSYTAKFAEEHEFTCIEKRKKPKEKYNEKDDEPLGQTCSTPTDTTPITVKSENYLDQHDELWAMLIPDSGMCNTVQGEVIRIGGRVHDELMRNAGGNWDADYMKMLGSLCKYYIMGEIHDEAEYREALRIVHNSIDGGCDDDDLYRLIELNVHWVLANPVPIALDKVTYRR